MISLYDKVPLVFQPSFPEQWNVRRLPGASPQLWRDREGAVFLQTLKAPRFSIEYFVFRFIEQASFFFQRPPGLQSIISLQGRLEQQVEGQAPSVLEQNQFTLVDGAPGDVRMVIPADQECHLLHTHYGTELRNDLAEAFPSIETAPSHESKILMPPQDLNPQAMDAIRAQFRQRYSPDLQQKFFELKVRETLFSLLTAAEETITTHLDSRQLALVEAARDYIIKDISRHYSNLDIARAVGTNEADLKRWFRQVYGLGLFGYLQRTRFEKAHELLLYCNYTIKQVAAAVGYRYTTTFITEFRNYYGYTPSALQKKG